jgi:DNA-binding response OmpR family regulator
MLSMSTAAPPGMSILLADDDLQLATFLSKSLETEGYSVHTAPDESTVLDELKKQNYQLIILDLNLGQTDGLVLLERLRNEGTETPVMVLSARNRLGDRIRSFKLGADDYVTKPFSFQELAARASALLRRKADPALKILRSENLELDPATRKVHRGGTEIKLSPKEFDMLALLLRRGGHTVSRQELLRECWGQELESDSNLVDVYVNYLRKKVDAQHEEKLIHTVRGAGYRIGKDTPPPKVAPTTQAGWSPIVAAETYAEPEAPPAEAISSEGSVKSIVHSMTHDLAQPLTTVRCFLESLALDARLSPAQLEELKSVEQQADRAIALARGISAVVRQEPAPRQPSISLHALCNEIFDDLRVLLHSGQLVVERNWETDLHVTTHPTLRHLIVLLIAKVAGRNAHPLLLTITATTAQDRCAIHFQWKANDSSSAPVADARTVFARDVEHLREMIISLGGEFSFPTATPELLIVVPGSSPDPASQREVVH